MIFMVSRDIIEALVLGFLGKESKWRFFGCGHCMDGLRTDCTHEIVVLE